MNGEQRTALSLHRMRKRAAEAALCLLAAMLHLSCASGRRWVEHMHPTEKSDELIRLYDGRSANTRQHKGGHALSIKEQAAEEPLASSSEQEEGTETGPRPELKIKGSKRPQHKVPADGRLLGTFRNTYYDFPAEGEFVETLSVERREGSRTELAKSSSVSLMGRSCEKIKDVPRSFFESICVQGSGTLIDGSTVSFARRDCECAQLCPRTDQRICFDRLDPQEFPWGRGAMGKAIVPLSSVAVDSDVIPLGTPLYIAEYDGVERHPTGGRHSGCFVAEDRGMKVKGQHVDIFTGNPKTTAHLNETVPSNIGVHVYVGTSRCPARL